MEVDSQIYYFPLWVGVIPQSPTPSTLSNLSDTRTILFEGDFQWDNDSEWSEDLEAEGPNP